jgi:hypothetical protein
MVYIRFQDFVGSITVAPTPSHRIFRTTFFRTQTAATVLQTEDWRSDRRTRLYHSCIDILVQQINDLSGQDIHFRFWDHLYRRSRVFLDFLCMDGDEGSSATMCPTTQCTTCWCPKAQLSDPDAVFPFRNTEEVREKVAQKHRRLLHRDGTPRDRCKAVVCYIRSKYGIY